MGVDLTVDANPPSQESLMIEESGMNQSFTGYAAPIDAGASQNALFKHQNPRPVVCGTQGSSKSG
jgi:hypothetical protein